MDTGSWRDLSAKTTNGKEGSLVHVTNDITYKAGDNSGCADLLDTSGNAVTSFSTKEGVSEYSGRGVGMGAVQSEINNLSGLNVNLRPENINPEVYYKITEIFESK